MLSIGKKLGLMLYVGDNWGLNVIGTAVEKTQGIMLSVGTNLGLIGISRRECGSKCYQ